MAPVRIILKELISKDKEGLKFLAEYYGSLKMFSPFGMYVFISDLDFKYELGKPIIYIHGKMKIVGHPDEEAQKKSIESFANRFSQLINKINKES